MDVDVRESLGEYAHEAWASYMTYLFSKCKEMPDGTVLIGPRGYVQALKRLMKTPYNSLTEPEKDLDRVEADKMLEAISKCDAGRVSDGYHTFDELYLYRKLYNAALFNEWAKLGLYEVHKSLRHSDGELCFGGGWFVVSATLPTGQVSNHYKVSDFHLFSVPERERAVEWDGHTPAMAADRIHSFLLQQSIK